MRWQTSSGGPQAISGLLIVPLIVYVFSFLKLLQRARSKRFDDSEWSARGAGLWTLQSWTFLVRKAFHSRTINTAYHPVVLHQAVLNCHTFLSQWNRAPELYCISFRLELGSGRLLEILTFKSASHSNSQWRSLRSQFRQLALNRRDNSMYD